MNPSVLGAGAVLVLVLTWWLTSRRQVIVLRSTDASAVAALNRAQIAQVLAQASADREVATATSTAVTAPPAEVEVARGVVLPAQADARGRALLLRQLRLQLQGPTAWRLAAMTTASAWGDRSVLPLLRRGLRDADHRVVLAASAGMAGFRGRCDGEGLQAGIMVLPLPRNAASQRCLRQRSQCSAKGQAGPRQVSRTR